MTGVGRDRRVEVEDEELRERKARRVRKMRKVRRVTMVRKVRKIRKVRRREANPPVHLGSGMPLRKIHKPLSPLLWIFLALIRSPFTSSHFLKKLFPSAKRSFETAANGSKDEVGGFGGGGVFGVASEVNRLAVGFQELWGKRGGKVSRRWGTGGRMKGGGRYFEIIAGVLVAGEIDAGKSD